MPIYSFDLTNYEEGRFTATRFPNGSAVSGDWVCSAPDDAAALDLARKAAFKEWNAPESRDPQAFAVEFVGARGELGDKLKASSEAAVLRSAKNPEIAVWKDNDEWLVSFMDGDDEVECLAGFENRQEAVEEAVATAKRLAVRAYSQDALTGVATTEWEPEKPPKFKLISLKGTEAVDGSFAEALAAALHMDETLQPGLGVTVEDAAGDTVATVDDGNVEVGDRSTTEWWAWHDADSSRWSPGDPDEATKDATRRALAWVTGDSKDGPALDREHANSVVETMAQRITEVRAENAEACGVEDAGTDLTEADCDAVVDAVKRAHGRMPTSAEWEAAAPELKFVGGKHFDNQSDHGTSGDSNREAVLKEQKQLAEQFSAVDLTQEAHEAVERGDSIERRTGKTADGMGTELLIVAGCRAGLVTNGDAVWGDWDADAEVMTPDKTVTLDDGSEVFFDVDATPCDRQGVPLSELAGARRELAEAIFEAADEDGIVQPDDVTRLAGSARPDLHGMCEGHFDLARALGCATELDAVIRENQREEAEQAALEQVEARKELAETIYDCADANGMVSAEKARQIAGNTRPELHSQTDMKGLARGLGCLAELETVIEERLQSGDDTRDVSEVVEILHFDHLAQMEGGEAAAAILRRYERLMTEEVEANWDLAKYGLRIRYHVQGVGQGIKAIDYCGDKLEAETDTAADLAAECLSRATDEYWKERRAELTDLVERELPEASELRTEALVAVAAGHQFLVEHRVGAQDGAPVTTLVLYEQARAGQSAAGKTTWGDWDPSAKALTTKEGRVVHLDGHESGPKAVRAPEQGGAER